MGSRGGGAAVDRGATAGLGAVAAGVDVGHEGAGPVVAGGEGVGSGTHWCEGDANPKRQSAQWVARHTSCKSVRRILRARHIQRISPDD